MTRRRCRRSSSSSSRLRRPTVGRRVGEPGTRRPADGERRGHLGRGPRREVGVGFYAVRVHVGGDARRLASLARGRERVGELLPRVAEIVGDGRSCRRGDLGRPWRQAQRLAHGRDAREQQSLRQREEVRRDPVREDARGKRVGERHHGDCEDAHEVLEHAHLRVLLGRLRRARAVGAELDHGEEEDRGRDGQRDVRVARGQVGEPQRAARRRAGKVRAELLQPEEHGREDRQLRDGEREHEDRPHVVLGEQRGHLALVHQSPRGVRASRGVVLHAGLDHVHLGFGLLHARGVLHRQHRQRKQREPNGQRRRDDGAPVRQPEVRVDEFDHSESVVRRPVTQHGLRDGLVDGGDDDHGGGGGVRRRTARQQVGRERGFRCGFWR
mmetsp:Transcript_25173/g.100215  ORF Transcript_25173/g.100215 Transcript_25173/m.100215 type:complete len:383 (-) Transcript_25173:965-2113(-)